MSSHRQIFRSSAVIGGASAINILIGIAKVKVLAVLLGPAGVGLMGFYQNILNTAVKLAGVGTDRSGVRQVAAAAVEAETLRVVRSALLVGNLVLGIAGMLVLWLLRDPLSQWVFGNTTHSGSLAWLGLGLLLALLAGSQTALLQGLRRIDDMAKVTMLSALVSALVGVLAVYFLGEDGVIWFVVVAPAVNVVAASYYTARLPRHQAPEDPKQVFHQWLAMLKLGIPFMAAGLLMLVTQLAARSIILREMGLDASGFFQAAWTISMTYVALVLNSMAIDYFPRLTAVISDHSHARRLVNEQAEMALLLAGPALIVMITLAPWIIQLLYAESFSPAADVLIWQILGDILKVASWPIGYIFLANGRGGIYIGIQLVWSVAYLGTLVAGINELGLEMAGMAYGIANLCLYVVVLIAANRLLEYKPTRRIWVYTGLLLVAGGATILLSEQYEVLGYLIGAVSTILLGVYSLHRLNHLVDVVGWLRLKFR